MSSCSVGQRPYRAGAGVVPGSGLSRRAELFGLAGLFLERGGSHVTRGVGVTSLMLLLVEELQIWRRESCDRGKRERKQEKIHTFHNIHDTKGLAGLTERTTSDRRKNSACVIARKDHSLSGN